MRPLYAIRQKSTGFMLPEPKGRLGRGGSHVEPVDCSGNGPNPRLFKTAFAARCALTQWLRGKHVATVEWEQESWEHPSYQVEGLPEIIPQPHRVKEDMEVVPFHLFDFDKS